MADLIDSLIGYVNDVKPYHTKIFGVEVEYVVEDSIDVEISEDFKMKIFMGLPVNEMKQLGEWNWAHDISHGNTPLLIRLYFCVNELMR